jgi:hypothetical protein
MRESRRIIIVRGKGTFGEDHYREFLNQIRLSLSGVKRPGTEISCAEVEITDLAQATERAKKREVDTVLFMSKADYSDAKKLRIEFPKINVFVFAGVEIDDQPYVVPKSFFHKLIKEVANFG